MASFENFLAYWLGFADGNQLIDSPHSPNIVAIAFGVTGTKSTIDTGFLTSKHTLEDILCGARALQARGQKVVLSMNGNPHPDQGWNSLDPELFAKNAYDLIVRQWGFDGIDLDNEDAGNPGPHMAKIVLALRKAFGPQALITLPVYLGTTRDAYLEDCFHAIDFVSTMAYWEDREQQIALYRDYASVVGPEKVAIGVSNPGSGDNPTPGNIVPGLARYEPPGACKAGMMFWTLNSVNDPPQAAKWCATIEENLPHRRHGIPAATATTGAATA